MSKTIAFIGGGNMAGAIIGGLVRDGRDPQSIFVVDPTEATRQRLAEQLGVQTAAAADPRLSQAELVVWAVKPQSFKDAAAPCQGLVGQALHLSVMAGIPSDALARAAGAPRIVRAMPNTPALIGQGITGLYARPEVDAAGRALVESVLAPTGRVVWVDREALLDAVTALSGSGPAYVFYFVEAMVAAGVEMGLSAGQAKDLALATFTGAAELARQSPDEVGVLRERVTSKGGTTYAALTTMEAGQVKARFIEALQAACNRAAELGKEFGR